ncbi:MAG: hypothetical protein E7290_14460 [Lachnospiraceae bacterium]|nr:hypothetical protein [Lachnospiraceae bacterium]
MPSQEEYLDNLLKDLNNDVETTELDDITDSAKEPESTDEEKEFLESVIAGLDDVDTYEEIENVNVDAPVVEELSSMSEEDIEKLLSAAEYEETKNENIEIDTDLMDLLQEYEDRELQDIHDMLDKSDHNEAVDEEIVNLIRQEAIEEEITAFHEDDDAIELLLASTDPAEDDKMLQKRLAKEKKKQLKEEKRLLKEQKRLEKRAKKEAKAKEKTKEEAQEEIQDIPIAVSDETSDDDFMSMFAENVSEAEPIAEDDLFGGLETVDLSDDSESEVEPDILQALTVADDVFGDDSFDLSSLEEVPDLENERTKGDKEKKKGFFAKVFEFLTESDDEEDEASEIKLSQENENILKEMDAEKGKKKSKKKNKKGKDPETGEEAENEGEEEKKPKKVKKPKKAKAPKVAVVEEPGKKLSKKRVSLIMLICISFSLIIIVINHIMSDYMSKKEGINAYYKEDYQTCYQNLYGKALSETEKIMYYKSESIMRMRVWIREYEIFAQEGAEAEALDSLIQTVDDYTTLYEFAQEWNASSEVAVLYQNVIQILSEKYNLTETQAKEIAATPDDVTYTKKILALIAGEAYGSWDIPKAPDVQEIPGNQKPQQSVSGLPDLLPEEEELTDTGFVDNIQ